ncbi:MAG: hypothetical protein WKF91_23095 [Segetibacter sp.]
MRDEIVFYKLKNHQVEVVIANYGCTIVSIFTPGKNNVLKNIVAGFTDPSQYLTDHPYMGAIVGRFANRIALANSVLMVSNINCLSIMRLIICMVASTVSIRNSGSWKMKMMVFFFPTQARMVKKAIPENLWCIFISNYHLIMS